VFVLLAFLLTCIALPAFAEDKEQVDVYENGELVKSVVFFIGVDKYFINGETPGIAMDAKPFIQSGRTFVPIRYLGNALGVTDRYIGWKSPKVTFNQPGLPVVELSVGKKQIISDGRAKAMDVAPLLKSGRTYLPARFVAEALGYQVAWDPQNKVVLCWPKGEEKPDVSGVIAYVTGEEPEPEPEPEPEEPEIPQGSADELIAKAKPFEGEPFDFNKYWVDPDWKEKALEGTEAMYVTVDDLVPNGIRMDGSVVLHNVKVTPEGITMTVTSKSRFTPHIFLVEEGNLVRYHVQAAPMSKDTTTVTQEARDIFGFDEYLNELPQPDLTKMPEIIFYIGDSNIIVKNPIYQGS